MRQKVNVDAKLNLLIRHKTRGIWVTATPFGNDATPTPEPVPEEWETIAVNGRHTRRLRLLDDKNRTTALVEPCESDKMMSHPLVARVARTVGVWARYTALTIATTRKEANATNVEIAYEGVVNPYPA